MLGHVRANRVGAGGDWAAVRQAGRARASERWRLGRAEKTGPRLVRLSGLVAGPNGRRTRAREEMAAVAEPDVRAWSGGRGHALRGMHR